MIYRRNPNPTRVTPRARRHLHSLSPSAPYSLSALLPQSPHRRRPSKVVADPSPRGAGPSSRTATRAGAPPPDVGPPPVVHPPAALLSPPPGLLAPPSSHEYCDNELYHFLESCAPSEAAYLHHCPVPSSRHVSMTVIIVN
jgi:hypothetical protein